MMNFVSCWVLGFWLLAVGFLAVGCATVPSKLDKPADIKPVIEEVERSVELNKQPDLKYKIVTVLKDCEKYSVTAYEEYKGCMVAFSDSSSLLQKKDKEIKELNDELEPWRNIKMFFWVIVVIAGVLFLLAIVFFVLRITGKLSGVGL